MTPLAPAADDPPTVHVHFVFPRWQKLLEDHPGLRAEVSGYDIGSFRMASLGIPSAAAALPEDVKVTFHDENLAPVDFDVRPDLVGVGFFTPQAGRAYAIADAFRARGVPTIAGGIHPSMAPDDTLAHFDAAVVGEVEGLWPRILGDLEAGRLKGRYGLDALSPELFPKPPRRDLFEASSYLRTGVVQLARGCGYKCPHCVVPFCYGRSVRRRPVEEILADIEALPYQSYYVADESFLFADPADRAHAVAVLEALVASKTRRVFYIAAYPWMLKDMDAEFLALLRRANCLQLYLVCGLYASLKKELSDPDTLASVERVRAARIEIMGSFLLGHDGDDASMKQRVLDFCAEAKLHLVELAISTPWPGTPEFDAMKKAGRLLHEDWAKYNCANVVFQPKHVSPDELMGIYLDLWRAFYKDVSPMEMKRRYVRAFGRGILDSKMPGSS